MVLVIEIRREEQWVRLGQHSPGDSGSVSSLEPLGRQVYVFGWVEGIGGPAVWRSTGGIDSEIGALRHLTSLGLEQVADLNRGPHEMTVQNLRGPMRMRFRLATR